MPARGDRIWFPTGLVLAVLELSHPVWSEGSPATAVAASGVWWTLLHVLLMVSYSVLVGLLWRSLPPEDGSSRPRLRLARMLLLIFGLCNTLFLLVDGPAMGWLARSDPEAADRLWTSSSVAWLADGVGAAWAAMLLCLAWTRHPRARGRVTLGGLVTTWLAFVASAIPLPGGGVISRAAALGTGAWSVYSHGAANLRFGLLVFAAVLHQHAGPEAALGILFVVAARE